MDQILALLIAALPRALMLIASKIFTDAFFQKILTKIILSALNYAAALTTNTVDDQIVAEIERALNTPLQA